MSEEREPSDPAAPREPSETPASPEVSAAGADSSATGGAGTENRPRTWWERRRARKLARRNRKAPWWEFPLLILTALAVTIGVKTFVAQPFFIPSQSMEKTLHGCAGCDDDRILVNKLVYDFRQPHPGDIVVFKAPPGWDPDPVPAPPANPILRVIHKAGQLVGVIPPSDFVLVKRVIAVGGQTVKGDAEGHVYVSDHGDAGPWRMLDEPYVYRNVGIESYAKFGPVTVPKGRLWVMGDHRDESADSRYHCGPGGVTGAAGDPNCNAVAATVPVSDVIGKAIWIIWPISRWTTLGTPSTFRAAGPPLVASVVVVGPLALALRRRRRRRRR